MFKRYLKSTLSNLPFLRKCSASSSLGAGDRIAMEKHALFNLNDPLVIGPNMPSSFSTFFGSMPVCSETSAAPGGRKA